MSQRVLRARSPATPNPTQAGFSKRCWHDSGRLRHALRIRTRGRSAEDGEQSTALTHCLVVIMRTLECSMRNLLTNRFSRRKLHWSRMVSLAATILRKKFLQGRQEILESQRLLVRLLLMMILKKSQHRNQFSKNNQHLVQLQVKEMMKMRNSLL